MFYDLPIKSSMSENMVSVCASRADFSSVLKLLRTRSATWELCAGLSTPILSLRKSLVQSFSMVLLSPLWPAALPQNLSAILAVGKSISSCKMRMSLGVIL